MPTHDNEEEQLLQAVALRNAQSILHARQRAEEDLTEAKEALERRSAELAQSLSLMRATLESTADGILATDRAGRVTDHNQRFVDMWGIPRAVMESHDHRQLLEFISDVVRDRADFLRCTAEIIGSAPSERLDTVELADGRVYEQFTRVQLIGRRAVGRVWSYRDMTERVRSEEALREAKEAAEAASRAKSEFLAVMSHELRTPLNAIGGYVELIEMGIRGPVTADQREDLRRIQKSQRHLLGLINEVLNYTRVESGTVQYEIEDVQVGESLAAAQALVAPQLWERGISLTVAEVDPGLRARADAEKLRQILLNLLSNAVKFTPAGGAIEISAASRGGVVEISVRDTGIGIEPDKLGTIFDPFVQVRSGLTRPSDGAGLGLAISRDLARGMGGELSVASSPGVGSTFTVTLPAGGKQLRVMS